MPVLWLKGVISVREPITVSGKDGGLVTATIKTNGDPTHTFVERTRYHGAFMPGYRAVVAQDPVADHLPPISFGTIALAIRIGMIWRLHALGISLF